MRVKILYADENCPGIKKKNADKNCPIREEGAYILTCSGKGLKLCPAVQLKKVYGGILVWRGGDAWVV